MIPYLHQFPFLFYLGLLLVGIIGIFGLVKGISSKSLGFISISLAWLGNLIIGFLDVSTIHWEMDYYGNPSPFVFTVLYFVAVFLIALFGLVKAIKEKSGLKEVIICTIGMILAVILGYYLAGLAILVAL